MAGLLGDIYSYGNTLKRKVNGLLADPAGTAQQFVGQLGDDTNAQINNMLVGYGMFGNKSVLADPKQVQQARNALADYGAQTGIAGMFVGKGSKTWDAINAKKAEELAAKGVDPRKIWQETGTWKGPDGMWRQEVDDSGARMDAHSIRYLESAQAINPLKTGKLSDVLTHRKAYGAYPDAQDIGVDFAYKGKGGAYAAKTEWGDPEQIAIGTAADSRSTALHELQHAIQQREGFARGGSPNDAELMPFIRKMYADNIDSFGGESHELLKMAKHRAYQNLAGEAEARATQARIPLDAAQRRALFPEDSYDVPVNQLIIRGLLGQ